ncbi:MAG TPA: type II secretion system minor pseudopilin GspK [Desulfomonilia bacterium]
MRPLIKDKKGVVLILVLAVCALFYILIFNFKSDQGMDRALAYNFRDSLQLQYLGSAGVEAAMSILADDDNEYDADDEDWAKFSQFMMVASGSLEDMNIEGKITDECSKLDINSLVELDGDIYKKNEFRAAQLKRLMIDVLKIDISDKEADDLINSICDWIDIDNEPQPNGGAEDDYYKTLDEPYDCKDGPMDSPEEILLVKGMKKEWYYGTEDYKGIGQFITAGTNSMGKGVVNLNTASKEVLMCLAPRIDEMTAEQIIDCRPFKKTDEVLKCIPNYDTLVEDPNEAAKLKAMLDIQSTMFSVDIKGTIVSTGATINTKAKLFVIDNGTPQIVYYKIY